MSIIYEAYNNLFTTKQRDNESLQEYTRRFKTATEVLETHTGGPIILEKLINKNMTDIKGLTDKEMMTRQVSDGFLAYLYLEQADKGKYGSILQGLTTQLSLGNDQFPKTMIEAQYLAIIVLIKIRIFIIIKNRPQIINQHQEMKVR